MRTLSRANPAADLVGVHGHLNRLFGDVLGAEMLPANGRSNGATFVPRIDALETRDGVVVTLEIAGIDPTTLDVSISGDELTVKGEKPTRELPEDAKWHHAESLGGTFVRTVSIPVPIDADAIRAEAKHGVLTIHLPKRPEVLPKRIEVASG